MSTMNESPTLTHEQFLQQYVLNRALGHTGGLQGSDAVWHAERAWKEIEKLMKDERKETP